LERQRAEYQDFDHIAYTPIRLRRLLEPIQQQRRIGQERPGRRISTLSDPHARLDQVGWRARVREVIAGLEAARGRPLRRSQGVALLPGTVGARRMYMRDQPRPERTLAGHLDQLGQGQPRASVITPRPLEIRKRQIAVHDDIGVLSR
jgi:hypothetical protein